MVVAFGVFGLAFVFASLTGAACFARGSKLDF